MDIDDAAEFLIRQHGISAAARAEQLAEAKRDSGDAAGGELWMRVARVVDERGRDPAREPD